RIPAPSGAEDNLLRATVFDSIYDSFRGVVSYVRLISGSMKRGTRIKLFATERTYEVKEVGYFTPKM
ncbi:MAG TPA: elongation factor 4, partial [Verrucomicrobiales bacterium]|nr:elongation factor 4 [Verrucomicrobiales bacterium]